MKRLIAAVVIAMSLMLAVPTVRAQTAATNQELAETDRYEDAFSNPLRLAYYLIYPVGFTAEWLIMRPLHYLISRPYLSHLFGYRPIGEEGSYERMGEHM
jgi:hypothetical protein